MLVVHKFTLYENNVTRLDLPESAEVIHVGNQGGAIQLWALVDTDLPTIRRRFLAAYTGRELPRAVMRHIGTVMSDGGNIVHHVFEQFGFPEWP